MTTQPQDKMRAEFEEFLQTSPAVPDWARNDVFDVDGFRDMYVQMMWEAWQAACAQQSAQASQDALDAARWHFFRDEPEIQACTEDLYGKLIRNADDLDHAIDSEIAAQGASNV